MAAIREADAEAHRLANTFGQPAIIPKTWEDCAAEFARLDRDLSVIRLARARLLARCIHCEALTLEEARQVDQDVGLVKSICDASAEGDSEVLDHPEIGVLLRALGRPSVEPTVLRWIEDCRSWHDNQPEMDFTPYHQTVGRVYALLDQDEDQHYVDALLAAANSGPS